MATEKQMTCSKSCCPCGWLGKRVLGLSLGVWLLLFAVLPMSARGVSWSARTVAGLWDNGAKVVGFDGPARTMTNEDGSWRRLIEQSRADRSARREHSAE